MDRLQTLLVATDLSPHADLALARAAALVHQHDAALVALHVVDHVLGADRPPDTILRLMFGTAGEVEQEVKRRASQALIAKLDALELPPHAQPRTVALLGTPFLEIIRQARTQHADLVVLGAHGRRYLKRWLLGTTAERVVRKGDRPVLVVKCPTQSRYRQVLVPTDFSDQARQALIAARQLAPAARFTLLNVYDFSYDPALDTGDISPEQLLRLQKEYEQEARARLEALAGETGLSPDNTSLQVRYGYPGKVIAAAASRLRADLTAIGTRGRSGLEYVLLGSVAEHVLREVGCDVLAVPPRETHLLLP